MLQTLEDCLVLDPYSTTYQLCGVGEVTELLCAKLGKQLTLYCCEDKGKLIHIRCLK